MARSHSFDALIIALIEKELQHLFIKQEALKMLEAFVSHLI